jgi:hypothetical protein
MATLKIVTIAAGLLVGGTSLAMAQYGGWYPGGYGYGYAAAPPGIGVATGMGGDRALTSRSEPPPRVL